MLQIMKINKYSILLSLAATNQCKCLACTDASSDEECRENGEYEDCDATVSQIKM